jgi:hypothetical protein
MPAIDALDPRARTTLLEVLACIARADGSVSEEERAAYRGAAIAVGASDAGSLPEVGADLGSISTSHLAPRDARLTYCAAAWMVLADALVLRGESRSLAALSEILAIDPETARFLSAHARWVRTSTELPWHREIDLLISEAARRLDKIDRRLHAA